VRELKKNIILIVILGLVLSACMATSQPELKPEGKHNWIRTNPGGGGAIATVGATASGTILSASDLSGVYRSFDGGKSWDVLGATQGLYETHIASFGFHPTDGNIFFVGSGWGIYKTTDGGEHFSFVHKDGYIEGIVIAASNPQIGYMAYHEDWDTYGSVYKTTDGGDSWHAVKGENLPDNVRLVKLLVHPKDENLVYALAGRTRWGCSDPYLFKSTDGGVNWQRVAKKYSVLDMDVDPNDTKTLFVSTFETKHCSKGNIPEDDYLLGDENTGEFYKSVDGGNSFVQLSEQTGIISVAKDPKTIRIVEVLYPYDWNDNAGTWETKDGGKTWTHAGLVTNWQPGWSSNQYFAFAQSFNGFTKTIKKDMFNTERFYGSFGQWAWSSVDGGKVFKNISTKEISPNHWQSTGMDNINGHAIEINEANPDVIYMGAYDLGFWTSRDRGKSWKRTLPDFKKYPKYVWSEGQGGNVTSVISDPKREGVVWAAFHKEGFGNDDKFGEGTTSAIFKSSNHADSWQLANTGLPDSIMFYGLSLDKNSPVNNRVLYLTVNGDIYKSSDDGNSWAMVLKNGGLKFTAVDNFDSNLVYAGGESGFWRSSDAGKTWQEAGPKEMRGSFKGNFLPTSDPWEGVFDIVSDPNIKNRVYAIVYGKNKGLYRSDDAAKTWQHIYTNDYMRGVAVASENSEVIYAGSTGAYFSGGYDKDYIGVIYSRDGGKTWDFANDGMAWTYAGKMDISNEARPYIILWSPGTGMQMAEIPFSLK